MTDPTIIGATATAAATIIGALAWAVVKIINAMTTARNELVDRIGALAHTSETIKEKVDGNFSDVKADLSTANQRIAVLTERLLTTSPTEKL